MMARFITLTSGGLETLFNTDNIDYVMTAGERSSSKTLIVMSTGLKIGVEEKFEVVKKTLKDGN
jgi:hypothetical protein